MTNTSNVNKLSPLGDYIKIFGGVAPSKIQLSESGKFPYVKVEDLNNCPKYQRTSRSFTNDTKGRAPKGSIIFPKRGAAIMNNKIRIADVDVVLDTNLMAILPNEKLNIEYLFYTISHEGLYKIADTSTIPQLNNKHINPYQIYIPNLKNQDAVVAILKTWDDSLHKLDLLIEKKQQRIKALSDKLILRKSVGGSWGEVVLREFIEERSEKSEYTNQYPALTSSRRGVFLQEDYFNRQVTSKDNSGYKIVRRGDFTFRSMSDDGVFVFNQQNIVEVGIVSPAYSVFEARENADPRFLYYLLNSSAFKRSLAGSIQGGTRVSLKMKALREARVEVPSLAAQREIGKILDCAELDIAKTIELKEKIAAQRSGLMQKLLTGEWRVGNVDKDEAAA
jgi:type I restriction enzyme S subunit